jgi:enoyl-[acyl-carrier protein] reductase II
MFEGDLNEGELEIGQIAGLIHEIKPAKQILDEIIAEYQETKQLILTL